MRRLGVILSIVCVAVLLFWLSETDRTRLAERGAPLERKIAREPRVESAEGARESRVESEGDSRAAKGAPVGGAFVHVSVHGFHPYTARQRERFRTRTGSDGLFVSGAAEFGPIPHRTLPGHEGVRLVPDWPKFVYLTVRYEPVAEEAASRYRYVFAALDAKRPKRQFVARIPHPGVGLIGPLRVGEYDLWRTPVGDRRGAPKPRKRSLGMLEAGHHEIEWRD